MKDAAKACIPWLSKKGVLHFSHSLFEPNFILYLFIETSVSKNWKEREREAKDNQYYFLTSVKNEYLLSYCEKVKT